MTEPWQRLPALSLKQLQYFVTLARLRHFTDTADRLAISQPALSSALRHIEAVLGGRLFNRTASAVTLTALGASVLPHAERILNVAQSGFEDMRRIADNGGDGSVRIGLVPSVSSLMFPDVPRLLAERFPRVRVEFHDHANDSLVSLLEKGRIDFAIGALDNSVPSILEIHPLQEDPLVAVMPADDALATPSGLDWQQLDSRDIVVFARGNVRRLVVAMAESGRYKFHVRHEVSYLETLYGLVRSGLAIAILPRIYTTHLHDNALSVVPLEQPSLTRTIALMRSRHATSPLVDACFQAVLSMFGDRNATE
ncbi:LysR family transcriptional regulator [Musicola paradisiaca]|uniref:Transcriptional regulator, LysR family n=1 Tax=Musicola paradisiaca (strain Ech703) TaxID=579405 RepID=C6CDP6_MUSP7|nr:LysR family transcriptional regulator [Musicola paradisiaca]ACS85163.1 transcriptional regulator, LysR family [Musicola paradisiaca Ech703]